ncbi:MAG: abortive infection family protein [Jatrophihabitantaceae bacterium]
MQLDNDPHRQVQQCLFLRGAAVNRLRNQTGTGHGRPSQSGNVMWPAEARLVARTTALIAGALLDKLWSRRSEPWSMSSVGVYTASAHCVVPRYARS